MHDNQTRLLQLQEENQRLHHSVQELSILNEVALAIASARSLDKIIDLIIQKCVRYFNVEQGAVLLLEQKGEKPAFRTMVRKADQTGYRLPYRLDTQLTGWMLQNRRPLTINDCQADRRFVTEPATKSPIHSLLAVPLMLKSRMTGLFCLFNKKDKEGFTPDDQRLLTILAAESAQIIENARLYQEEQEFQRVQEELRVASQIQRQLLPKTLPNVPGYDLAAVNIPARGVSGDYYDFIPRNGGQLSVCLGDVSGKGMPAALLMANLQATIRGQVLLGLSLAECLHNANFLLYNNTSSGKYATLFLGMLDSRKHEFAYSNGGHNPPFLFHTDGSLVRLGAGGLVLGFLKETAFKEDKVAFQKGDVLVIYSDGITEAMNSEEKEFGEERLLQTVQEWKIQPADVILNEILSSVKLFVKGSPQSDDMTLLIVKRKE